MRYSNVFALIGLVFLTAAAGAQTNTYPWPQTGSVGIGTTSPGTALDVAGVISADGTSTITNNPPTVTQGGIGWKIGMYAYTYALGIANYTLAARVGGWFSVFQNNPANNATSSTPDTNAAVSLGGNGNALFSGNVGIGTTTPGYKLDVTGKIHTSTAVIFPDGSQQTTAWTGTVCGGDYAESVDVSGKPIGYEPGDVLVIDPKDSGKFLKAADPYSTLVAGIYSTKPGLVGRRKGDPDNPDAVPMAMIGIVPTKVSAENGPIHPGDLLVTSSTLGYAMKGTDRNKMLGAVMGKALGNLGSGMGVIEVAVMLQ